jgi:hypothetical protein
MESEVRNTMPDLPPTSEIARLARSPSALLNHLSNMSPEASEASEASEAPESGEELPDGSFQPPDLSSENGTAAAATNGAVADSATETESATDGQAPASVHDATDEPDGEPATDIAPSAPRRPTPTHDERALKSSQPSGVVVPGDPTLN